MATRTWTAAVNTDFTNTDNWTETAYAVTGDTIVIASATAPTTHRPMTGTFHFSTLGAPTGSYNIPAWLDGASIGLITFAHDDANTLTLPVAITCQRVTLTSGILACANPATTITISGCAAGDWGVLGFATIPPVVGTLEFVLASDCWFCFKDGRLFAPGLTINPGVTVLSNSIACVRKCTIGAGGSFTSAENSLQIYPTADDALKNSGTISVAYFIFGLDAMPATSNYTQTTPLGNFTITNNAATYGFRIGNSFGTPDHRTITFACDLNLGMVNITSIHGPDSASGSGGLIMAAGCNLTCGAIIEGYETGVNARSGRLTLNAGTHTIGAVSVDPNSVTGKNHQVNYGGVISLAGNQTLAYIACDFRNAIFCGSGRTLNGADAISLASANAIIQGGASVVTINNMTGSVGTIFARRWTGTGNGTAVKTLAPHWLLGMR